MLSLDHFHVLQTLWTYVSVFNKMLKDAWRRGEENFKSQIQGQLKETSEYYCEITVMVKQQQDNNNNKMPIKLNLVIGIK